MSDPLKKYIQQAKHRLDVEHPDPDLFGKIMSRIEIADSKPLPVKRNFSFSFQWMAVAASLIFLIVCSLFLITNQGYLQSNHQIAQEQNKQLSQDPVNLKQPTNNTATQEQFNQSEQTNSIQETAFAANTKSHTLNNLQKILKSEAQYNNASNSHLIGIQKEPATIATENPKQESKLKTEITDGANTEIASQNAIQKSGENSLVNQTEIAQLDPINNQEKSNPVETAQATSQELVKQQNDADQVGLAAVQQEECSSEGVSANQNLKGLIKKGIFGFVSKKAKKWSGDALSIENKGKKDETILAVHYKNEKFEFSKAIHF